MADYDPLGKVDPPGGPRTPHTPAGVTWRELPADAPEPPPLSVVRTMSGDRWVLLDGGGWACALDDDEGVPAPIRTRLWAELVAKAGHPLELGQPEGVPWPPVESVEPSGYEIRDRALGHATHYTVPSAILESDATDEDVARAAVVAIRCARHFEAYLRGDGDEPYAPPAAPLGTYGWRRDRDGRIRHAYLDDADIDPETAETLARKYAEAPGYSLVVFGGDAGTWVEAR